MVSEQFVPVEPEERTDYAFDARLAILRLITLISLVWCEQDQMATRGPGRRQGEATAVALGNQANNGNRGDENDGLMTLATFLKVHPPTFRGTTDPTEDDNWL
ncbi:hypothetical protein AHAS_Ahas01G0101900 [Arachis hypogaea]